MNRRLPLPLNSPSDFPINGWRLSHAIAMTISSRNLYNTEYWLDAIASNLGLSSLIDRHSPNIRINSKRIESLRDFSRTSRIGETSQGTVYLYLEKNGYPYIVDFHIFCKNRGITIPPKSSTPDFVAQNQIASNQLCLVESKGKETTSSGSFKTKLKKALSQCDSGEQIINNNGYYNVTKKFGFCAEWSDENNDDDSMLHWVDPENEVNRIKDNDSVLKLHYAAWFYMIGDFRNSKNLMNGKSIEISTLSEIFIDDNKYFIPDGFPNLEDFSIKDDIFSSGFFEIFSLIRFINRNPINFLPAISETVVRYLEKSETQISPKMNFESFSSEDFEFFADGTAIIKKPNE
ncbi:hypothetical protein [Aequorivita antarctica]|uniref:Restriction endonuclease n=1 Tax=Aequorivita antarctica TaxID=153266 RepID=A0A5C6Z3C5_9FLAO|nr:hypothetical protein [Aequorivita antarctica]TXD73911.1 hypothetical protein ESU54_05425 [Aequorivita antarctica]